MSESDTSAAVSHDPSSRLRRPFLERLSGALRLDASTYDEVEHDPDALPQAIGVVAIAALCAGLGSLDRGLGALAAGVVASWIAWLLSTAVVWLVGVRILEHSSDYPELLRTIGFAQAPQIALLLASLPGVGGLVKLLVFGWGLAAYVVAVREALDVATGRAVLVCVLAWALAVFASLALGGLAESCAGSPGMPG